MLRPTLEQQRIAGALEALGAKPRTALATALKSIPNDLRANGLGAGLAMLAAKGKDSPQHEAAGMIARWLLGNAPVPRDLDDPVAAVLRELPGWSRDDYRLRQAAAIGYASTLKRLAAAFSDDQSPEADDPPGGA